MRAGKQDYKVRRNGKQGEREASLVSLTGAHHASIPPPLLPLLSSLSSSPSASRLSSLASQSRFPYLSPWIVVVTSGIIKRKRGRARGKRSKREREAAKSREARGKKQLSPSMCVCVCGGSSWRRSRRSLRAPERLRRAPWHQTGSHAFLTSASLPPFLLSASEITSPLTTTSGARFLLRVE